MAGGVAIRTKVRVYRGGMTSSDLSWAPESCTLPTLEHPVREREFADLFRDELRSGALLSPAEAEFVLGSGSRPRAEDLVAREGYCCSFFSFALADTGDGVRMAVRVPERYADVLAALVASAERAAGLARS